MKGTELEFQTVYETFQPRIYRYLARLVGETEAEDLSQEVFVKVSQSLANFRGEAKLSTWVYRIATNAAIDRMRSPSFRRVAPLEFAMDELETGAAGEIDLLQGEKAILTEQQIVRKEMNDCVRDFIESLPQKYRTVLILGELEGLTNKEIAEILEITLGTVKIRLHRARNMLREELENHCDSYWVEGNEFVPDLRRAFEEFRKVN